MNLIAWNYRGLGTPQAVHEVRKIVNRFSPNILFLCETKKTKKEMEWIRVKLGFTSCFSVDSIGRSGGLAVLWTMDVNMVLQSFSRSHIDMVVSFNVDLNPWRFIGFYGEPDHTKRDSSWRLMRQLASSSNLP